LRWLADECVDAALVAELRHLGYDVTYVAEQSAGLADPEVLKQAREGNRLLLTEDKDFGDLVFRSRLAVPGVVLLRLSPEDRHLKWDRLKIVIEQFGAGLDGRYVVVEKTRMRSRPLLTVT
jgi:predicted nuclease of predicted toxin-antitoxin system